jgi:uncharacterized protein YecE (DUF72 family)
MWLDHKARTPGPDCRIGCSGWQYQHWRNDFYPAGLPASRWFARYAETFDTVEINNSFYRLPEAATFARWQAQAPPDFLYAVKASRFLTHMKKLKDPADPLARFFGHARHLGPRLGPVLYQLPPRWPLNLERLEAFLTALAGVPRGAADDPDAEPPPPYRHVMEFRDPSWYDDRALEMLRAHDVALCLHDMAGSATGRMTVGPFVYVRFHGATKYGGRYEDERLDEWAAWLDERLTGGMDVFAYFNNDIGGHAPRDAVRLRDRLARLQPGRVVRAGTRSG